MTESFPPPSIELDHLEGVRGARKLIAVGGGRGGVGKSLVAQNLAVYFAQLGKSVVARRRDPTGREPPHAVRAPGGRAPAVARRRARGARTSRSCRRACRGSRSCPARTTRSSRRSSCARAARRGGSRASARSPPTTSSSTSAPATRTSRVDLMLAADFAICVTVPEPPAIETTYRFVRAAYRRRLRRALLQGSLPPRALRARHRGDRHAPVARSSSIRVAHEDRPRPRRARVGRGAAHAPLPRREPDARAHRPRARRRG